jgi:hypothetical protein
VARRANQCVTGPSRASARLARNVRLPSKSQGEPYPQTNPTQPLGKSLSPLPMSRSITVGSAAISWRQSPVRLLRSLVWPTILLAIDLGDALENRWPRSVGAFRHPFRDSGDQHVGALLRAFGPPLRGLILAKSRHARPRTRSQY